MRPPASGRPERGPTPERAPTSHRVPSPERAPTPRRRSLPLDWRGVVGIAISVALLWWVLRDVEVAEVLREIGRADLPLFLAATAAATLVFPIRAMRWRPILLPMAETALRARFAATAIGFMANNLLPARAGEFARAYALARFAPVSISGSFGSLVVERLFDGVVVVGLLAAAVAWPGFPQVGDIAGQDPLVLIRTLLAIFGAGLLLLTAMVLWPRRTVAVAERATAVLPSSFRRPVVDALRAFVAGLGVLRDPGLLAQTALWSLGLWLFNAAGFWLAFRAFGIDLPFIAAVFLQSLISLAVAIPSAPGFFGLFEAAAKLGLVGVWGVEATRATAFAIGFHIAGFIPITLIGLYYVWRLGFTWREVEASEEIVEDAVEEEASDADPGESPLEAPDADSGENSEEPRPGRAP